MDTYTRVKQNIVRGVHEFHVATKADYREAERAVRDMGFLPVFGYRRAAPCLNRYRLYAIKPWTLPNEWHAASDATLLVTFARIRYTTKRCTQVEHGDALVTLDMHVRRVIRRKRFKFRITRGMHYVTVHEVISSNALDIMRKHQPEESGTWEDGKGSEQWYIESQTVEV